MDDLLKLGIDLVDRLLAADLNNCAGDAHKLLLGITTFADTIEHLSAELETERMRNVACGVVALANTPESAKAARDMHPDYMSASCDDVAKAVDREIAYRERIAALEAENKALLSGQPVKWCFERRDEHDGYFWNLHLESEPPSDTDPNIRNIMPMAYKLMRVSAQEQDERKPA